MELDPSVPDEYEQEAFWHNAPTPLTWWDVTVVAGIWIGMIALGLAAIIGFEYLMVEVLL